MNLFAVSPLLCRAKALVRPVFLTVLLSISGVALAPLALSQTPANKPKSAKGRVVVPAKPSMPKPTAPARQPAAADALTKEPWCFERIYEQTHLESNPDQLTKRIWIWNRISQFSGSPAIGFSIAADIVNGQARLGGSGSCVPLGAGLTCSIEADGSGFVLARQPDGGLSISTRKGFLLVPASFVPEQLSEAGNEGEDQPDAAAGAENTPEDQGPGPDGTVMLGRVSDDKSMRLAAAPYARCMGAADEYRPVQAPAPEEDEPGEDGGEDEEEDADGEAEEEQ